jgi:hypothetical protein
MTDIQKLKALAEAAHVGDKPATMPIVELIGAMDSFKAAANPAAVLELIAEIERLKTLRSKTERDLEQELEVWRHGPFCWNCGDTGDVHNPVGEWLGECDCLSAQLIGANHQRDQLKAENTDLHATLHAAKGEIERLKAENEALRKHAPSTEIIWCECGDGYPANSYGAGFMDANGGVCENCDAAHPKISCPLELFEGLRDAAAEEAEQHRQCMGSYRPGRQEVLDAVVRQCDELIAGASKEASNG